MYDENLLIELIRHSIALNQKQKHYLVENLSFIAEIKKRKLFDIFAAEQKKRRKINKRRIRINNKYARDVKQISNAYKEKLNKHNEAKVLKQLDEEMEDVFSTFSPEK